MFCVNQISYTKYFKIICLKCDTQIFLKNNEYVLEDEHSYLCFLNLAIKLLISPVVKTNIPLLFKIF